MTLLIANCKYDYFLKKFFFATEQGTSMGPMQFVFSQCIGVFLASTLWYWAYGTVALIRKKPVQHSVIRPAFISGLIWVAGNILQLYALGSIGKSVFPLIQDYHCVKGRLSPLIFQR